MFGKPLQAVTVADLRALCANKVAESSAIDFKQELPGGSDKEKKEFLSDVCAFANADGGTFVYGISETSTEDGEAGLADELVGLGKVSRDDEKRRLTEILRSGIQPRLHRFEIEFVGGDSDPLAMLLEVEKSWNAPHRVSYKKPLTSFPVRHGPQKAWMDVTELRDAFLRSDAVIDRVRSFQRSRVDAVFDRRTPVPISEEPCVAVHLVPVFTHGHQDALDLRAAFEALKRSPPFCLGNNVGDLRYNLDGVLRAYSDGSVTTAYLQLFRDGSFEAVGLGTHYFQKIQRGKVFFLGNLDEDLVVFGQTAPQFLQANGVAPPYALMASLVRAEGRTPFLSSHDHFVNHRDCTLYTDRALLPDLLLEAEDLDDIPAALRPLLDVLWQSFGFERCFSYSEEGTWKA